MDMLLKREPSTLKSTPGCLYIDSVFFVYTLEDPVREKYGKDGTLVPVAEWKIPGKTAIPAGRYVVQIDFSQRFRKLMPHLLNVPGFTGVRIHSGNKSLDTEGCILVGRVRNSFDEILQSRAAYENLFTKLSACADRAEPVHITIENALPAPEVKFT